jgi:hypothetical protein
VRNLAPSPATVNNKSFVWPEIIEAERTYFFGGVGYRDALCALLGVHLERSEMVEHETMHFFFENGTKVQIPLGDDQGPEERAILWQHGYERFDLAFEPIEARLCAFRQPVD